MTVAMTCMVIYKGRRPSAGFHCLVEANHNLTTAHLVYGKKDNDFVQIAALSDSLMKVGNYLRIKSHPIKDRIMGDMSISDIYLSRNLSVYRVPPDGDASKQLGAPLGFALDTRPLNDQTDGIFIIKNAESIFPIDIELSSQKSKLVKNHRLRPEFLRNYPKKLNPDSMQDSQGSSHIDNNDFDLTEANKVLLSKNLFDLIKGLDSMEFLPMDSAGISRVFHQFGVNLRYLG